VRGEVREKRQGSGREWARRCVLLAREHQGARTGSPSKPATGSSNTPTRALHHARHTSTTGGIKSTARHEQEARTTADLWALRATASTSWAAMPSSPSSPSLSPASSTLNSVTCHNNSRQQLATVGGSTDEARVVPLLCAYGSTQASAGHTSAQPQAVLLKYAVPRPNCSPLPRRTRSAARCSLQRDHLTLPPALVGT
jgi:hypothetical protein